MAKTEIKHPEKKVSTRFNAVYAEFFPGVRPARTTVQSGLGEGMLVEIDAIARAPNRLARQLKEA